MKQIILSKWYIVFKILPLILLVIVIKSIFHILNWEFISINPIFTGLIGGNIFLIGFLLTGTLSDYKESERLPGELTASIEAICDECLITYENKKSIKAKECLDYLLKIILSLKEWFYKKERTKSMLGKITSLNDYFLVFESLTQANFIARLKQEQNNIRRTILRIDTIRDTSFIASGYAVVEMITFLIITGVSFIKIEPFYESLFLTVLVTFFMTYMIALIKDLDNPFDYAEKKYGEGEISLKHIDDLIIRIEEKINNLR